MLRLLTWATPVLTVLLLTACSQTRAPDVLPPLGQHDFASYQAQTRDWLARHRVFVGAGREAELAYNSPQEWRPQGAPRGGVLLVHGLGDSPFSFSDLGPSLAAEGYLVRTVLLPGHGSKPADLIAANLEDWQAVVAQQTALLQQETGAVWLGGFSTGGNLVLQQAMQDDRIAGLLLFSPGFKSGSRIDWLAPLVAPLRTWLHEPDPLQPEQTAVRYLNVPTNGFGQFYRSSSIARDALAARRYDKPALMVLAEHDSVLDVAYASEQFRSRFTHPDSRLIWYGRAAPADGDRRILWQSDHLPQQRISQFSHMSVLFSPDNALYGRSGKARFCLNGQEDADTAACQQGKPVWYSDWGYREPGKVHARLTFNPYFNWQLGVLRGVMQGQAAAPSGARAQASPEGTMALTHRP